MQPKSTWNPGAHANINTIGTTETVLFVVNSVKLHLTAFKGKYFKAVFAVHFK